MADLFPAKSVTVEKIFRARCNIPGCPWHPRNPWHPGEHATFADAAAERQQHLDWHARQIGVTP